MPRRPLAPGEAGDPSEPKWNEDRQVFQIYCLIGEPIGKPSRVWASGETKRKAKDALKRRIAEWKPRLGSLGAYGDDPTVLEIVLAWLKKYENDPSVRPQNARMYRREIETVANPNHASAKKDKIVLATSDLGKMKAKVTRPLHIRLHLEQLNRFTTKQALHKTILNQAFLLYVEDGGRDDNPVASIKGYRGEKAPKRRRKNQPVNPYFPDLPEPLDLGEMDLYLKLENAHFAAHPARDRRYLDYRQLTYEIAGRPGEAVALRMDEDIDFDAGTITIAGTIVDTELRIWQIRKVIDDYQLEPYEILVKDGWEKLPADHVLCVQFRQPFTKTHLSMRTIKASTDTMAMLRRRKLKALPGQRLVLPSRTQKILPADQMSLVWRAIVKGSPLEGWTSPKTLRSTRATRVAEKYGRPAARLILGHEENSPVTRGHYVAEEREVVNFADAR
ncbi:hypothetical protein ACFYUD_03705 [Nocardia tengchongensis]|uniref:hypothetical protein n=1 Tax=Nocardia tengchongensis TaxID=2055889 RepID=UPI0036812D5F